MDWKEVSVRLFVAFLLGASVGFERQIHHRVAGLRTNILVCLGSAAFTLFGFLVYTEQGPARLVSQIISGIGFLGAGAIMRDGMVVHGLNTAATIWCSAAIGVFCGAGLFLTGFIFSLFIMLTNIIIRPLAPFIGKKRRAADEDAREVLVYLVEVCCSQSDEYQIRALLFQSITHPSVTLKQLNTQDVNHESDLCIISAFVESRRDNDELFEHIISRIILEPKATSAKWTVVENEDIQKPF